MKNAKATRSVFAGRVADVRVAVAKGLYVVTVDGRSTKITVR